MEVDMHAWESIQKVVDYIEENLTNHHSPEELSKIAVLSPFYFQRLFARLVKRPVNEYVKMRKLARACKTLEDKSKRILDIALEHGFNSHEHFTKTFKSAFKMTPEAYRNNPVRLNQVMKPDLLLGYTIIDEDVPLITDSIVLKISRKTINVPEYYIGFSATVSVSEQTPLGKTTGIDVPGLLWDKFHKQKDELKGIIPNGIAFGVSTFGDDEDGTFNYFAGASATPHATVYDDVTTWALPAAEYIVCSFEAENMTELTTSALGKSMNYLFGTWLPKHNLSTQPFSAEKYVTVSPEICKMELWVIPVPINDKDINSHRLQWSECFDSVNEPSKSQISTFVDTPLWDDFSGYLQETYDVKPKLFYSHCSMHEGIWKGWNIKYKKSNKALCTLYPKSGYFVALIAIGIREMNEAELLMPSCTEYTRKLFEQTVLGHSGKSLAFDVKNAKILDDVKKLVSLRVVKP